MRNLIQDIRLAARQLLRDLRFSVLAVLISALAIGGATAMFAVVQHVLLKPLPYGDAERLLHVGHDVAGRGVRFGGWSPQDVADVAAGTRSFERMAWYLYMPGQASSNAVVGDTPIALETSYVSADFFATLAAPAAFGRSLGASDLKAGDDQVVVLSHRLWKHEFGADANAIGRSMRIADVSYRIVGVMPEGFDYPSAQVQVWLPLSRVTERMIPSRRDVRWLELIGLIKPGVSTNAAYADLAALTKRLADTYPESNRDSAKVAVEPLIETIIAADRGPVLVLFAATLLVLLTACVNLANLMLARATKRRRDTALNSAIGADPTRLLRQKLAESLLISVVGAAFALIIAQSLVHQFVANTSSVVARQAQITIDASVFGFAAMAVLLTALLSGLLPALRSRRVSPAELISGGRGAGGGKRDWRVRNTLVVLQIALVCALIYSALNLTSHLRRLAAVDTGVNAESVWTFNLRLQGTRYEADGALAAGREKLLAAIRALPQTVSVASSKYQPFGNSGEGYTFRRSDKLDVEVKADAGVLFVTPGYFRTLGVTMLRGSDFSEDAEAPPALIINESLAKQWYPDENALGQRLRLGEDDFEIVGIVADVRHAGPGKPAPSTIYAPSAIFTRGSVVVAVRTRDDSDAFAQRLRETVWSVDPDMPITSLARLSDSISALSAQPRLLAWLLGGFALLAAVIGAVGVYSVMSYIIAERRLDLAVRLSLGATREHVFATVMRSGLNLALLGIVIGVPLGLMLMHGFAALLLGVEAMSATLALATAASALLLAVLASLAPALSALATEPSQVLREG